LSHCVNITGIQTLFVSAKTAEELLKFHQKGTLKTLIHFDKLDEDLANKLREEGLDLLDFWQLVE
jgi:DNA-directed RNA polymerase subunit F